MTPFKVGEVTPLMQPMAIHGDTPGMPGLLVGLPAGAVVMAPETTPGPYAPVDAASKSLGSRTAGAVSGPALQGNSISMPGVSDGFGAGWVVVPPAFGAVPGLPAGVRQVDFAVGESTSAPGSTTVRNGNKRTNANASVPLGVSPTAAVDLLRTVASILKQVSDLVTQLSTMASVAGQGQWGPAGAAQAALPIGPFGANAKAVETLKEKQALLVRVMNRVSVTSTSFDALAAAHALFEEVILALEDGSKPGLARRLPFRAIASALRAALAKIAKREKISVAELGELAVSILNLVTDPPNRRYFDYTEDLGELVNALNNALLKEDPKKAEEQVKGLDEALTAMI